MFDKIIAYSVQNKFVIGLLVSSLIIWGSVSLRQIPIDAVPDITNNQVQVITTSPTLATQEIEQFITTPIELSLQNLQKIEEIRSISRFGLSVVTVVFEEGYDVYLARQLVNEQLVIASEAIPNGLGKPELAPISTGLGEIYQYVIKPTKEFENKYTASELRSFQDWIVRRQLSGIEGVAEINSMGGYLKQYEVAVDPALLKSMGISISEVFSALENSNENTGGAYIEKTHFTYYIRSEGIAKSLDDIGNIVLSDKGPTPILIRDIANVQYGEAPRYGALVMNGKEVVGGKVMMFKGANSAEVTEKIKERVIQVQKSLPEGIIIEPYLVRDKLIKTAIGTVKTNLLEGGLIVIFILVLMLGNWRAGLIVASVIPLAMLFAIAMMKMLGISANLMSLGAIDFGLIVDGAVIIVESIVHRLQTKFPGQKLTQANMNAEVIESSQKIRSSAAFGEIIILMVYIPILALVGIEGKMFKPMAQTVMLAIAGALILSLTYVPMMVSIFINKRISNKKTLADTIIRFFQRLYTPVLHAALKFKTLFVIGAIALFAISLFQFRSLGGEFIPTLEEGDLAMQHILPPGSSLAQSVETAKMIQNKLLREFPEIEDAIVNIGSAEIPTDPMPVEIGDYALIMKPKSEWTSAPDRKSMFKKMEESLQDIPGIGYEFTQPIQLRFNELMTGTKADIAVKLYGDDLDLIYQKAKEAERIIADIDGVGTVNVEQTIGMPQVIVRYDYAKLAQYGLHIKEVNSIIRSAFAGEKAGVIYEGEQRFDLVVRLKEGNRSEISDVKELYIPLANGSQIPLEAVAKISLEDAPMQISRENTNRRIVIGVNVGDSDVESLVEKIQTAMDEQVDIPPGYYFSYGGQFENLKAANARLAVAVPLALALIFILLFFTFSSFTQAILIFTAIPLSAIGGVWALLIRDMPFSISAGIGFIALFGVAVLNGIVLIGYFNQLKKEGVMDIRTRIIQGTSVRLRPVIMTAAVASLGFLPMAISTSGGAEVQRPLATVVIGGLITATFLTLVILPILYYWLEKWNDRSQGSNLDIKFTAIIIFVCSGFFMHAQQTISLDEAIQIGINNHPSVQMSTLAEESTKQLKDMKYNMGRTQLNYQGDALFETNGQRVNQIGIAQYLPNPSKTRAINSKNNVTYKRSELRSSITKKELEKQISITYLDLQYSKATKELLEELVKLYASYLNKAETRVQLGVSNPIESLNIKSKLKEFEMLKKQEQINIEHLEDQLQLILLSETSVTSSEQLEQSDISLTDEVNKLWLQEKQLDIEAIHADIKLLKSETKPDFNLAYSAQNYTDGGWLHGIQAGVSFNLFRSNNKQMIAAQKIRITETELGKDLIQLDLQQERLKTSSALARYQEGIEFYKHQKDELVPELERIVKLNYDSGDLRYLELLAVLNQLVQAESGYLSQVYLFNKTAIHYKFITK